MIQHILISIIFAIACLASYFYWKSSRSTGKYELNQKPVKNNLPEVKISEDEYRRISLTTSPEEFLKQRELKREKLKITARDISRDGLRSMFLLEDEGIYHNSAIITDRGWSDLEFTVMELSHLHSDAAGLLDALDNPDSTRGDINTLCERSVGLAARVLKLVNSPFYGVNRNIDDIQLAVALLGYNEIRQVVLVSSLFSTRDYSDGPIVIDELWKHSLATAGITTWLNDIMKNKGRKGLAGAAAMLHDVGKLVLQKWRPEAFRRAVVRARENKTSLMQEELSELGLTHALAGTFLLNYWHLPLTLQWLVKGCHSPEINSELPETALVYLSNQVARRMDMGLDAEEVTEIPDDIRKLLGFKAETIDELIGDGFEEYVTSALDGLKVTVSV